MGEPATQALESTYARSEEAHWALAGHYFDEQSAFDADNVLERTREFLAANTDLDAGMNAGAGRTTPTVFLFRDGRYRTRAAGSVSFSVVKNALGL